MHPRLAERGMGQQVAQEAAIVAQAQSGASSIAAVRRRIVGAVAAVRDQLGDHRVVERRDLAALGDA